MNAKAMLAQAAPGGSLLIQFRFMIMHTTVEGVYQDGVIKLAEQPIAVQPGALVLVTFLSTPGIDLRQRGIDAAEAAELRFRLSAFSEDWDSPEMAAYDDYHALKSPL